MTAQQRKSFIHGAGILAAAGIVIKIIGACFRIPLGNLIGGEGMGYYNAVYPIYTLLVVIATTGVPIAVSRLVAERETDGDHPGALRVFKISAFLMLAIGAVFFAILFFGAEYITAQIKDLEGAAVAMVAIAPALIFVPVMAAFRGYFQGQHNMKPTAASQITEQLFRVLFGLFLAYMFVGFGKQYAAAGGTFGATAGAAAGLASVALVYFRTKKARGERASLQGRRGKDNASKNWSDAARKRESTGAIIRQVVAIALPITVGAAIMPIMYNIDMLVVPNRLSAAGFAPVDVRSMYGQLTGFAEPITNLPKVLTQAIAVSMVPTIVRAFKQRDEHAQFLRYNVTLGLRLALIIGLPCAIGVMVLSEPVMRFLYRAQIEDAVGAAPALFIFGIGIVFLCSIDALTSVLQGIGKQMLPFINIAIGAACKFGVTYVLTGIPTLNIKGAALGTVSAYLVATILNYRAVVKHTGVHFNIALTFIRPLVSALGMGLVAGIVFHVLRDVFLQSNDISVCAAILLSGLCYLVLLFATRSLKPEELLELPRGEKMLALYRKLTRK